MNRSLARITLLGAAVVAAVGIVRAADDEQVLAPAPPQQASSTFFHSYLAPRMSARLGGARAAVMSEFASPTAANPWTRSIEETEDRVQHGAIRATKSAIKKYALERLNLTGWSIPLSNSGAAKGLAAFRTESGGPRLRVGFSHRAPNAEAILPLDHGKVGFSADLRGRIGASYETTTGWLRVGATVDPREDTATAGITVSF